MSFSTVVKSITSKTIRETVAGLVPDTVYYYRVRAVSHAGTTPWSNTMSVTTKKMAMPAIRTVSSITSNAAIVSSGVVTGATSYKVEVSTNSSFGGTLKTVQVTGTSATITGLSSKTGYYVRVKAQAGSKESNPSSAKTFKTK